MKSIQIKSAFIFRKTIFLIVFGAFLWSCNDTATPDPQPQTLVSATLVKEYSREEFIKSLGTNGQALSAFIRMGVKQYKLIYRTKNTDGTSIEASGGLIIPTGLTESIPLVSYQHGTIFNDADAPSYFSADGEGTLASVLASLGYIISTPDYIGYGASKQLPHPYEHREGLATASLDMLRAAKEYIEQQKFNWNKSVYLTGYSEGGYATMSLLKKIEETALAEFPLKAVTCGAGAYNKTLSFKNIVSSKSSGDATHNASYIWVMLTYDRIYKLDRSVDSYFIEPYATQIKNQQQNVRITGSLDEIIQPSLKKAISESTDKALLTAIADNDVFDWKPQTPLKMYHGDKDTYVPLYNSQTAYDAMKKRGATNVSLEIIPNGTHGSSAQQFLFGSLSFFSQYK